MYNVIPFLHSVKIFFYRIYIRNLNLHIEISFLSANEIGKKISAFPSDQNIYFSLNQGIRFKIIILRYTCSTWHKSVLKHQKLIIIYFILFQNIYVILITKVLIIDNFYYFFYLFCYEWD